MSTDFLNFIKGMEFHFDIIENKIYMYDNTIQRAKPFAYWKKALL